MIESREPNLVVVADFAEMSRHASEILVQTVRATPEAVICVPTGNSPLGMFADLIRRVREGAVDLSRIHLFCLDEYVGVAVEDPNSLTGWLLRAFVDPAGIARERVHAMPATDPNPESAVRRFEDELQSLGGLDLAILGLGPNGHVAYSEPGSAADSRTRVLDLTAESRTAAAACWEGEVAVPARGMTIGVGTLLEADRLVLIVSGAGKAAVLRRTLREPMNAAVPASWLRLAGSRLTVIADEAAVVNL